MIAPHDSGMTREAQCTRLLELLRQLYEPPVAEALQQRLLARVDRMPAGDGPEPLGAATCMLITYGDSIRQPDVAPLVTLNRFLQEHLEDTFSAVHVLPFFPASSDDGFAVVDFRSVDRHLGDWADIDRLAERVPLMTDLVINHCSRENLWFADFINDRLPGRDYFIAIDGDPAHGEPDLSGVTRPRNSPLLSDVHTYRGIRRVWTTFSEDQVDLNFANPEVLAEMVDVLLGYIEHGARYIRLDAIAYLWKEIGTSCLHLPQTHAVVKILRLLVDLRGLNVRLVTETNVPHPENVSYFGQGDEAHMVYQFALAPLLLYSYVFEDPAYLTHWAQLLDAPPEGATYLNFIASHDGVGLRPLEGLVPEAGVQALVERMHERGGLVTLRQLADGSEIPYEINVSLFSAFGGALQDLPAFLGAHALLLAFQGIPAIYIHSLLASANDIEGMEQTGRTRSINRGHWDLAALQATLDDPYSPQYNTLAAFRTMIRQRAGIAAFSPEASQRVVEVSECAFALERCHGDQRILVIALIDSRPRDVQVTGTPLSSGYYRDLLTGNWVTVDSGISMRPFQTLWLDVGTPSGGGG